jgi:hypothetical protein
MEAFQFGEMDIYSDMISETLNLFGDCNFAMDFAVLEFPDPGNDMFAAAVETGGLDAAHWPHSDLGDATPHMAFDDTCHSIAGLPQADHTLMTNCQRSLDLAADQESQLEEAQGSLPDNTDDSKELRKRKWDDSILVFGAKPETKVVQRKRKAFSSSRKKEVARNRLIGACIQCKLRRGPVSLISVWS